MTKCREYIRFLKKNYRFQAKFWPSLVMGLIIVLCLQLSHWQWQRYHLKRALTDQYQAQTQASAIELNQALALLPPKPKEAVFLSVHASGHYDNQRQIVLDNRSHNGHAGYEVLTPLLLNTTPRRAILVNRGFIPSGQHWRDLPDLQVSSSHISLNGFLSTPTVPFKLGPAIETTNWPLRVARLDVAALQAHYPYLLSPYVLLLKPGQSGSYLCEWAYPQLFAERSLGYTFQWLALALVAWVLWFAISLQRKTS